MPFHSAGLRHGSYEGGNDPGLELIWAVVDHVENVGCKLEDGDVVDVFADVAPDAAQTGDALSQRFGHGLDILAGCGQAILKGESVEQHQAADVQGGGAVLLLVGARDDIGDAPGYSRVARDPVRCLLKRVPYRSGGCHHTVHSLKLQRECAQLVGKLGRGSHPDTWTARLCASGAVHPPLKVRSGLEFSPRVVRASEPAGIENADHPEGFRKGLHALVELVLQERGRPLPFAL